MANYTCKSSEELKKAIDSEIKKAMVETRFLSWTDSEANVYNFYSQGHPKQYKRTLTLPNSAYTTELIGGNGNYEFSTMFDETRVSWNTGTFSPVQVLFATENSTDGVLGKGGYIDKTEQDIIKDINLAFSKRFN